MIHSQVLVIRADASTQIGAGHVMRCLALAQAWQDAGGAAHFVAVEMPAGLQERLAAEGMPLHRLDVVPGSSEDAAQTTALARQLGAAWVVEDGYHFGADFQHAIKEGGRRLLAIDDYGHAEHYVADLVLNQNIYADESLYPSRAPTTQLLLGTRYALLRREFLRWRGWQRQIPDVARKVLLTMGGGDPDNVTLKVIRALEAVQIVALEVVVVVGSSNSHLIALQDSVRRSPHVMRLEQNVTDIAEMMAWADVAVAGGGSTCWELAFMGAPAAVLILAENQIAVASGLANAGAALNVGRHASITAREITASLSNLLLSLEMRLAFSQHGHRLVDGRGAARILRLMKHKELTLRVAQEEDCHLIWQWANDPVTRSQSFCAEPIPWDQHMAWFGKILADPLTHFYVAMDTSGRLVGQIRFQVEAETATVSVSLAPEQRGKGYGGEIIWQGSQRLWSGAEVTQIHAYIKPENHISIGAFSDAGYVCAGSTTIQGWPALWYLLRRPCDYTDNA